MDTWSLSMWVSPFRYPRLLGYLLLPAAFRSLSRLSSALSAKASALRPFLLNPFLSLYSVTGIRIFLFFTDAAAFAAASVADMTAFAEKHCRLQRIIIYLICIII